MKATKRQKNIINIIYNNLKWAGDCDDLSSPFLFTGLKIDLFAEDDKLTEDQISKFNDIYTDLICEIKKIK